MKRFLLAVSAATLMSGAVYAGATNTDSGAAGANMEAYGGAFSKSISSTFYSDPEMTTMRSADEVKTGWSALSQEDRDMVVAECTRYRTDVGSAKSTSDGNTTGGDVNATGTPTTGTAIVITGANMQVLCDTTDGF